MIELANAPKPKPLPATPPPLSARPAQATERDLQTGGARVVSRVQSKPVTSFGRPS